MAITHQVVAELQQLRGDRGETALQRGLDGSNRHGAPAADRSSVPCVASILRGEVRGANPAVISPVLVLSHNVTSQPQRAGFPLTLEVKSAHTLAVERLGRRITRISPEETAQVVEGFNEIVGE
jgi:mRNA interferase MazF